MDNHAIEVIRACVAGAHDNTMNFPAVVGKLMEVGVSSYHVDFLRDEITYYHRGGASHVEPVEFPGETLGPQFDAAEVLSAVRDSQQAAQPHQQFVQRVRRAGCASYIAYLDGRRVVYSGTLGDSHTEYFTS